ncbi:hypothetical protein Y032_0218g2434 [Ancylostoma ceylanicum]|uniref:Uncharacterized protein n=1 Tax=Ancylostoma ceylanicum TaxID=53326 RepID=A0A016SJX8_9BILA|nr:hypothetical protein Y032_0218g2434 [Ancylostoma ceylanicum]
MWSSQVSTAWILEISVLALKLNNILEFKEGGWTCNSLCKFTKNYRISQRQLLIHMMVVIPCKSIQLCFNPGKHSFELSDV